jgi:dUTP pyrophosphatase
VRPRSGLALKHGITIPNAPGTLDSDYRGELKVILQNLGAETVPIARGDRVAQLVFARYEKGDAAKVPERRMNLKQPREQPREARGGGAWR